MQPITEAYATDFVSGLPTDVDSLNWTKGISEHGQPIRDPEKDPSIPGTLASPASGGATNWPPPSFNPNTSLLYVGTSQPFSIFYLTDTDPRPQGYGAAERNMANLGSALKAIDYRTGKVKWSRPLGINLLASGPGGGGGGGAMGLLSTAGGLLFGNDGASNFVACDAQAIRCPRLRCSRGGSRTAPTSSHRWHRYEGETRSSCTRDANSACWRSRG